MRKMLEGILSCYEDGFAFFTESMPQVAHVTCIFSVLLLLWRYLPSDALVYTIAFAVYLICLGILGFMKFNEIGNKEQTYQAIFFVIFIFLFIVQSCLAGVLETFFVWIIISIITAMYIIFGERLISYTMSDKRPKLEIIIDRHPIIYLSIMSILMLLMFIIPVCLLEIPIICKCIIILGYIIIMPLVSKFADDGLDIVNMLQ